VVIDDVPAGNLPDVRALVAMGAMVDLYCASFRQVPKRIVLDIDDTFDAVHGAQQLRLFNAHHDVYGFQPIEREGIASSYMTRVLSLTLLAPDIVEAILDGKQRPNVTLGSVLRPFPLDWSGQHDAMGAASSNEDEKPVLSSRCSIG
jgi:hypothetical protein